MRGGGTVHTKDATLSERQQLVKCGASPRVPAGTVISSSVAS